MATTEVSDIVTMIDFVEEANVYGVQVPGINLNFFVWLLCSGLFCV